MLKNPLFGRTCYLSGPIELATDTNWRPGPKKELLDRFGLDVFDPFADPKQQWLGPLKEARENFDYDRMRFIAKKFVRKDLGTVDRSDMLIGYLPYRVPTTGTNHEIITSNDLKKPTLLICPEGKEKIPTWYYAFIRHEFMFGSWAALYDYLDEVAAGKHMDNDRWAFVYDLI
jgi:nucleoside 2-deoxyribosyltransferase